MRPIDIEIGCVLKSMPESPLKKERLQSSVHEGDDQRRSYTALISRYYHDNLSRTHVKDTRDAQAKLPTCLPHRFGGGELQRKAMLITTATTLSYPKNFELS